MKTLIQDQSLRHDRLEHHQASQVTSDDASQRSSHAVISDDESIGALPSEHITSDLLRFLEDDIDLHSKRIQRGSTESSATLLDRFESVSASLTTALTNISGSCISWSRELASNELRVATMCDALQEQRQVFVTQQDRETESAVTAVRQSCASRHADVLDDADKHVARIITDKSASQLARIVRALVVSVVTAPWLLFGSLCVVVLVCSLRAALVV